jgi:hypothetical protein
MNTHLCLRPTLLLATLMCALTACSGGDTGPAPPSGGASSPGTGSTSSEVYALMDPGDNASTFATYAALSSVKGLAFRALWKQLEPQDGQYDWTLLDAAVTAVKAQGKRLTVHVGASGGAWPNWLLTAGAVTYTYSSPIGSGTDPLPWDAVLLQRHGRFVTALAQHLAANLSTLRAVSDGAPVSEMSLVGCQGGMLGSTAYSRSSYLTAWQTTVHSHATAFPSTPIFVSAPVSVICQPTADGAAFYSDVMSDALSLPASFSVYAADLNALGSARLGQVSSTLRQTRPIALQTIWSASNDPGNRMAGSLHDAVCQGLAAGARYFELYKADLNSSDAGIRSAVQIAGSGTGCP